LKERLKGALPMLSCHQLFYGVFQALFYFGVMQKSGTDHAFCYYFEYL